MKHLGFPIHEYLWQNLFAFRPGELRLILTLARLHSMYESANDKTFTTSELTDRANLSNRVVRESGSSLMKEGFVHKELEFPGGACRYNILSAYVIAPRETDQAIYIPNWIFAVFPRIAVGREEGPLKIILWLSQKCFSRGRLQVVSSYRLIQEGTGLSEAAISRGIQQLVRYGLVEKEVRGEGNLLTLMRKVDIPQEQEKVDRKWPSASPQALPEKRTALLALKSGRVDLVVHLLKQVEAWCEANGYEDPRAENGDAGGYVITALRPEAGNASQAVHPGQIEVTG